MRPPPSMNGGVSVYRLRRSPLVMATADGDGVIVVHAPGREERIPRPEFERLYEPAQLDDVRAAAPADRQLPAPAAAAPVPAKKPGPKPGTQQAARASRPAVKKPDPQSSGADVSAKWLRAETMWNAGRPVVEIAKAVGVHFTSVYTARDRYGWKERPAKAVPIRRASGTKANPLAGRARLKELALHDCGKYTRTDPCEHCHIALTGSRARLGDPA